MFYYAQIDSEYQVTNVHALSTASTNPNYISITEEQYNSGDLVGKYYNVLLDVFEIIDMAWYMGDSPWVVHRHTQMPLSTKIDNMDAEINSKADSNHTHTEYASSEDLTVLEDVIDTKANVTHTHSDYATTNHTHNEYATIVALDTLEDEVNGKANANHAHNNYATTTALDELSTTVSGKANSSHSHDGRYYTETEIDTKLADKSNSTHNHTGVYDVSGAAASALSSANSYTDTAIDTLSETVATKANTSTLNSHTGNTTVHITSAERTNWNAAKTHADSTHAPTTNATQTASGLMSKADKIKLDGVAEGANNYVLPSAGVALGGVKSGGDVTISAGVITINDDSHNHTIENVDGLQTALNNKAASNHNHDDVYYTETEVNELLSGKANTSHTHTIANITSLQTALDGKASSGHTHGVATTTAAGFMSKDDKAKIDGIASGANAYVHPAYTARTGVPTANATLSHGGTFTVTQPVCDATGHITAMNTRTYTLPTDNNTDTKVTNTLATTTKAYVTGTTSASTNTGTQVFDTGVYLDTVAGKLTATTMNASTFMGSGVATVAEVETYLGI